MAGLKILRYYDPNNGDDTANGLVMCDINGDDDGDDDHTSYLSRAPRAAPV